MNYIYLYMIGIDLTSRPYLYLQDSFVHFVCHLSHYKTNLNPRKIAGQAPSCREFINELHRRSNQR